MLDRRWREDGEKMERWGKMRRWREMERSWREEDGETMRRRWNEDGEKIGRRWGEDGEKMAIGYGYIHSMVSNRKP